MTSSDSVEVNVTGRLKLGNFNLSFKDATIPVAGIPITIVRTYDTLDAKTQGDFGYGWSLSFEQAKVTVDQATLGGNGWGNYRAFETGTRVYVTTPDGRTEGFTFDPIPNNTVLGIVLSYKPYFRPDTGNTVMLSTEVSINNTSGEWAAENESGLVTYNPADPTFGNEYELTQYPSRQKSIINATTGELAAIEDRHGNRVDLTYDGVASNRGRKLDFSRDWPATSP